MAVHRARSQYLPVATDDFGAGPDHEPRVHPGHGLGISCFAEPDDAAVPYSDIGFDDAPMVQYDDAGDDQIRRAARPGGDGLPHRFTDDLAAAEDRLVARGNAVRPP